MRKRTKHDTSKVERTKVCSSQHDSGCNEIENRRSPQPSLSPESAAERAHQERANKCSYCHQARDKLLYCRLWKGGSVMRSLVLIESVAYVNIPRLEFGVIIPIHPQETWHAIHPS